MIGFYCCYCCLSIWRVVIFTSVISFLLISPRLLVSVYFLSCVEVKGSGCILLGLFANWSYCAISQYFIWFFSTLYIIDYTDLICTTLRHFTCIYTCGTTTPITIHSNSINPDILVVTFQSIYTIVPMNNHFYGFYYLCWHFITMTSHSFFSFVMGLFSRTQCFLGLLEVIKA